MSGAGPGTAKCPESLCLLAVLPLAGWRPAPPRRALPLLPRSYGLMRRTKSLPPSLALALMGGSSQVVVSPCWEMALPDVISADPSRDAWTPTPAALMVHSLVSSHETSAFPTLGPGRRPTTFRTATSVRAQFRGCSHSLMFRPPSLLATLVAPTAGCFGSPGAAVACTSEQNTSRYLPVHRICLPSEPSN